MPKHTDIRSDWLTAARPETHQNLIHNTKTNNDPYRPKTRCRGSSNGTTKQTHAFGVHPDATEHTLFSVNRPTPAPTPHKTNGGDYRIRTDDPLLAKQVLYQLS